MNESSLSEQNHFKWDDTSIAKISYQHRGHNMALSNKPGAVQSRFQEISQSLVNLGQSSQDFKKTLNCRVARGKSPSPSLGTLNVNPNKGLHTVQHLILGAMTNLSKILLKRNSRILEKFITFWSSNHQRFLHRLLE